MVSTFSGLCSHHRPPFSNLPHLPKQKLHADYKVTPCSHSHYSCQCLPYFFVGLFGGALYIWLSSLGVTYSKFRTQFLLLAEQFSVWCVYTTFCLRFMRGWMLGLQPLKMLLWTLVCAYYLGPHSQYTCKGGIRNMMATLLSFLRSRWLFSTAAVPFCISLVLLLSELTDTYSLFFSDSHILLL